MSNQAYSVSEDLMVGAGTLYFKRSDDPNSWHHLGNVDEFNITNDVEKIDKNSSMNKKRELMASVITSIKPTASITMTEYNPYNLALGLYGTEGVHTQVGTTLTNEPYTVPSVPGIITLTDADGNRYMDVKNVVVSLGTAIPASVVTSSGTTDLDMNTALDGFDDVAGGGKIQITPGTWAGTSTISNIMIAVSVPNTTAGDVSGTTILVQEVGGAVQTLVCSTSGSSGTVSVTSGSLTGLEINLTLGATDNFTASAVSGGLTPVNAGLFTLNAAVSTLTEGKDYTLDPQELRAGIIKIKEGGAVSKGDTIRISATIPDATYPTVNGGNAGDIAGELLFIGDPNIGGQYNIEGWKVKVTPEGDLTGLIGTEFGTFTLTVDFLSDYENHPECPYYKATMIGRASGTNSNAGIYDPKY